jgi:hypothetical protein
MGSKENLKVPFALLRLLGVPVYVVADGDADGAEKRYPSDSRKRAEAAGSHKLATDALVAWLPEARFALAGVLPYEWGGATTVTDRWCVWRDDLEAELESWPAYMTALGSNGEQLRSKNVAAARAAATEADLGSLPNALRKLVQALATFA